MNNIIKFRSIEPRPEIKPFVQHFSYIQYGDEEAPDMTIWPTGRSFFTNAFPKKGIDSVFHFKTTKRKIVYEGQWRIGGQVYQDNVAIKSRGSVGLLSCELSPIALYRLFGLEGQTLTDNNISLADVAPHVVPLAKRCFVSDENGSQADHIAEAEMFFSVLAAKACERHALVEDGLALIDSHNGAIRIQDLCNILGEAPQKFRRQFTKIVGLPPKFYAKIKQVNWAVGLLALNNETDLCQVALQAGFCDQAHFTKVFTTFFQQSPILFLESNHVELVKFFDEQNRSGGPLIATSHQD